MDLGGLPVRLGSGVGSGGSGVFPGFSFCLFPGEYVFVVSEHILGRTGKFRQKNRAYWSTFSVQPWVKVPWKRPYVFSVFFLS